jgi:hypothetical protein
MAFKYHTDSVIDSITPKALFTQIPILRFSPELSYCPICSRKLKVRKTRTKTIGTLEMGMSKIRETVQ